MTVWLNPYSEQTDKLRCDQCSYKTNKWQLFLSHRVYNHCEAFQVKKKMKISKHASLYPCDLCDKGFKAKAGLRVHKVRVHETAKIPCRFCSKPFELSELRSHLQETHPDESGKHLLCDLCIYETNCWASFLSHRTIHLPLEEVVSVVNDVEPLTVKKGYVPKPKSDYKPETCDECGMIFEKPGFYLMHCKKVHKKIPPGSHNDRKTYLCDFCSEIFVNVHGLNKHISKQHKKDSNDGDEDESSSSERPKCLECDKEFSAICYLRQHFTSVHGGVLLPSLLESNKKFMCEQCPKIFFGRSSLYTHQMIHHPTPIQKKKNEKLRKCPHCDAKFAHSQSLVEHVKSKHLNDTPFKCDKCHRSYGTERSLSVHFKQTHERQNCNICGKSIGSWFIMRRHKASAHGIFPSNVQKCQHCPMFFSKETSMKNHCRKQHPDHKQT